ncbi:membrane protein [Streptomyces hygroscopicus]|uniref:type II secretion system F family protein n=1 Tax=Streptomyces hygroscopicus TaxID=1912 RepID=UPI002240BA17|nr:type II secretion system F family protein [Streptomyces hygroscopicus]MCW7946654.1 membrane protein [Streptomyces hygroscopicus]
MSADLVHRLGVVCGVLALGRPAWALTVARRERRVRLRLEAVLGPGGVHQERRVRPLAVLPGRWGLRTRAALPKGSGSGGREAPRREAGTRGTVRRWLPVAGALCAGWVVIGGLGGAAVGLTTGILVARWRVRQERDRLAGEYDPVAVARQLPLAADLLAACIAAGAGPVSAAQAVGEALEGPVGGRLAQGAAEVRLGAEPSDAWRRLAALPGAAALARLLERAGDSGVPAAVPVGRLATEARAEWSRAATARARRAGVMVTAPVGLCFLPAFITVGVLPVVIGLAGGLLGGGGG